MNTVTLSSGSNDAGRAGGLLVIVSVAATFGDISFTFTQLQVLDSNAIFTQHNAAL